MPSLFWTFYYGKNFKTYNHRENSIWAPRYPSPSFSTVFTLFWHTVLVRSEICHYFHFPVEGHIAGGGRGLAIPGVDFRFPISIILITIIVFYGIYRVKNNSFSLRLTFKNIWLTILGSCKVYQWLHINPPFGFLF